MKFRILFATALFFCFIGCESIQERESTSDRSFVEQQDENEFVTSSPVDNLQARQDELDKLEQELNAEWASLRVRKDALEQQAAELDSLFTEIEMREKIAEMEITRAMQLRTTGGWMLFIGIVLIVIALFIILRPKKKEQKGVNEKSPTVENIKASEEPPTNPVTKKSESIKTTKDIQHEQSILSEEEKDEFYQQAKQLVLDSQKAAISFLQAELKIGRARVMKILEELEKEGIVGPAEAGKSRQVLK